MYFVFLGVTCSIVVVLPGFRPGGLPIAYFLVGIALLWGASRGFRLTASRWQIVTMFGATVIFSIMCLLGFGASPDFPLAARTGMGFTLFFVLVASVPSHRDLVTVTLSMLPAYLLNSAFGIGQYFGSSIAIVASTIFISDAENLEHIFAAVRGAEHIRPWGVMGFPHVYAFSMALWTLLIAGILSCRAIGRRSVRLLLVAALVIGSLATILSSQRSAVWVLVLGLPLLWLARNNEIRSWRLISTAMVIATIAGTLAMLAQQDHSLSRLGKLEGSAQSERETTWLRAARMIEEDPLFGTAFHVVPGERGIHNGYLAGWARFGLIWVMLLATSVCLVWRFLLGSSATLSAKMAGAILVLELLINGATHTNLLTLGDLVGWPYLAFALLLVSYPVHSRATLRPAIR